MASKVFNSSVSEIQGSDEIREMFCEECDKHISKYVPAEGFCVDCSVYMCDTCIMYHRRYMPQHNLQDKQAMPHNFCFEKCSVHATELIKFYCDKCDKIACLECRKNEHLNCMTIKHLPTIAEDVDKSQELQDCLKNMDTLSADLENTKKEIQSNIQYIAMQESSEKLKISYHKVKLKTTLNKKQKEEVDKHDKIVENIIAKLRKERQELVEQLAEKKRHFEEKLDNEETDIKKKMEKSMKTRQTNLDSLMKNTVTLIDELKTSSSSIVLKQNLGQTCETFIAMKTARENTNSIAKKVCKLKENKIHYYRTEIAQTDLTKESLENNTRFFSYLDLPSSRKDRIVTFHSYIKTQYFVLHSSFLLFQNKLFISYYHDKSIVIFNDIMQRSPSINKIDLFSYPWDIAKVKENKVAVTFPGEGIVQLITFSETMTVTNIDDINVGEWCAGIACSNDTLIVSYCEPGEVKILDMSGHELKTFEKQHLFWHPKNLALSQDNTTIYVSDYSRDIVASMTFDGKVKAIYNDDQLKGPSQLTVDDSGTIYVCGFRSNNVHQLSSDLRKLEILLDESDGIIFPQSVAYCQKSNRLYVGLQKRSDIKVYNTSFK